SKPRRGHAQGGEKPHKWGECGKSFGVGTALAQPRRGPGAGKPYACGDCGKSFSWSSHLDRHRRIHMGEKPFRCDHCGKSFSQSSHLERHQKIHEQPCRECGKRSGKRRRGLGDGGCGGKSFPWDSHRERSQACGECGKSAAAARPEGVRHQGTQTG
ncbi:ZN383 protein, partial [Climacteris rufus]|nr:ZN383 protein [Climacteris rufus]